MNVRTPAAAGAQHGFDVSPSDNAVPVRHRSEGLALNARHYSNLGTTDESRVTHSTSCSLRNQGLPPYPQQPPETSQQRRTKAENSTMTCASIEAYLEPETLRRLDISSIKLTYLWSASLDPPVTAQSLAELDLVRIINDAKLRHDLNFEREISFRPNVNGPRSQQKEAFANAYWEALTIEFALYIKLRHNVVHNTSNTPRRAALPWRVDSQDSRQAPQRLARMFATIRDVLKTLVPGNECIAVDQRLDIDLLMQELENGACDVKGLCDWLRQLLLGSCSPLRDPEVEEMANIVHEGVDKDDARVLIHGLKVLFSILETMKLDVANHQIRYLRLLMIEDSIHFEQSTFLRRISNGFNVQEARDWFEYHLGYEPHGYMSLTRGIWDMIVDGRSRFPATFCYDTERLLALQRDFRMELIQESCAQAFMDTLQRLGWSGTPPSEAHNRMLTRAINVLQDRQPKDNRMSINKEVGLEVVREAYRLCNITTLPNEHIVEYAQMYLEEASDEDSEMFSEIHTKVSCELADLVDEEVDILMDLTPLQMLNYLNNPGPLSTEPSEMHGMVSIARRLAHITVLHWKVWGPILYEQPRHSVRPASERPRAHRVHSAVAINPQSTLPRAFEDGSRPGPSRQTSTHAINGPKDSGARHTGGSSSEGESGASPLA